MFNDCPPFLLRETMRLARNHALNLLLATGTAALLGLFSGCGTSASFCDVAGSLLPGSATLAASYTNVSTTVGTPLMVVPLHSGVPVTGAALASGTLPPGMALNQDGSITGTPTQANVYPVMITLSGQGRQVQCPEVITVNAATADPINASYTNASVVVNTPLTVPATVADGGPVATATLVQGTVPPGMALDSGSGAIAGTPTAAGVYPLTVALANASGGMVAAPVTITVSQAGSTPIVATYSDASGTVGSPITVVPATTAGGPVAAATLSAGVLPPGLSLSGNGTLSGTPTAPGTYPLQVELCNASGACTSQRVTLTIIDIGTTAPDASYPDQVTTVGTTVTVVPGDSGSPIAGATLVNGSLPPGLTLNADGSITGTASTSGLYTSTIQLCSAGGGCQTVPVTITVNNLPLTLSYATPRTFTAGTGIATQTPVLGHAAPSLPITYAVTSGSLPAGLTLNASGTITGTPTTPGVSGFSVTATDGARSATASAVYTVAAAAPAAGPVTVTEPAGTTTTLVPGNTGGAITSAAITGGGSLPAGLTLNVNGSISQSGTTAIGGYGPFTVNYCNAAGCASSTVTITVTADVPSVSPLAVTETVGTVTTLTPGNTGGAITSATITAGGALPAGLTLNPNGTVSQNGTTVIGVYGLYTVSYCNGGGCASSTVKVTVTAVAPNVGPVNVTETVGAVATLAPANTGGAITNAAITAGGALPAGLTLNPNGTLSQSGTTAIGVYGPYTVSYCNSGGCVSSMVQVTVNAFPPAVGPVTITETAGAVTTLSPTNTGGVITSATITAGGALPAGLTLNPNGTVSQNGTTAIGVYGPYTVSYCNSGGCVSSTVKVTVDAVAPAVSPLVVTETAGAVNTLIPASTGGAITSAAITGGGTLPAGLTLNGDGSISQSGTTPGGIYGPYTVHYCNTGGCVDAAVTITVVSAPTASLTATAGFDHLNSGTAIAFVGSAVTLTAGVSIPGGGGSAVVSPAINGVTSVSNGTGYPTVAQSTPTTQIYTLTVTNALGATATATVKWVSLTTTIPVINTPSGTIYQGSTDPDSPFYNLQIVVPDQGVYEGAGSPALCDGDTTLTVTMDTSLAVGNPLPNGVNAYTNSFNFLTDTNHPYPFRVPVTVTLPYSPTHANPNLGADDLPVPFHWDPTFSKWEAAGLQSVNTANQTVTFTTLLPGAYAVLGIPGLSSALAASTTLSPAFVNGTDDWYQWNQGDFDIPGGSSLGMSSFAAWYAPLWKASASNPKETIGLHNVFATNSDINAQALISRLANGTAEDWNQMWQQQYASAAGSTVVATNYGLSDTQTGLALITGLQVTQQPQIFLMADTRPAAGNAVATAVYGYNGSTGVFSLLDPNYPGDASTALTIDWNPSANGGAGAFSSYNRAAGYSPTLAKYAFQGQTAIHRLQDYEVVFGGAVQATPWGDPPFASITMTAIGDSSQVANLTLTQMVSSGSGVTITGNVINGTDSPAQSYVFMSLDGGTRIAQAVSGGSFSFAIPSLPNPYGTTVMLETSQNPCDPTFSHSGFQVFKVASLTPWFKDACFETATENRATGSGGYGSVGAWTHQYVDASGTLANYPVDNTTGDFTGTFNANGDVNGYVTWTSGFFANSDSNIVGGTLVPAGGETAASIDPHAHTILGNYTSSSTYLPIVLSGAHSYRLNDDWNSGNAVSGSPQFYPTLAGNHRSLERLVQTITVPSSVNSPGISFWWAAVVQAGTTSHTAQQRPYVDIMIQDMGLASLATPTWSNTTDSSNYGNIYYHHFYAGDPSFAGWRPSAISAGDTEWVSIPWQKMNLNLTSYKGHKVRVVIAVSDCTGGAHAGYAYVDSLTCD